MLVDYHLHLREEGVEAVEHTIGAIERYVETGAARGVDELGFTEHVYYFAETRDVWSLPYQLERCRYSLDTYCSAVLEAKRQGLPVKLGLEVDWDPDRADELAALLAPYPWDFLLGSVHWIDGLGVDQQPGIWAEQTVAEVWERYGAELSAAARSGHFDVLAHPDLVKIFGDRAAYDWSLAVASMDNIALEVSTAGLRKPVGELYPSTELLRLARAAGTPITTASDAHDAADVGLDLDRAAEFALSEGYDTVTVYERRTARQEPLG